MRHPRVIGIAGLAAIAVVAVAFAQTTPPSEQPAPAVEQPAGAGATVSPLGDADTVQTSSIDANAMTALAEASPGDAEAGASKAVACAACHGVDGNSPDPQYPRIAGQNERYIARQLALFKSGERNTPMAAIMQPFAMPLSAQDMRDIGAYYAGQKGRAGIADDTPIMSGPYTGMKFFQVGEQIYRRGDFAHETPACMACHGPAGLGNPGPPYPAIGGQYAEYTARQLRLYRDGMVLGSGDDANSVMAAVAAKLTDEEIEGLASYIEGLHPNPVVVE